MSTCPDCGRSPSPRGCTLRLRLERFTARLDAFVLLFGAFAVPVLLLSGNLLSAGLFFATMVQSARDQAARTAAS